MLERHSNAAVCRRPAVAIAWIEQIIALAREIGQAELIKPAAIVLTQEVFERELLGGHIGIDGLGFWREEEAAVAAHFMAVDHHDGEIFQNRCCVPAGFWLG